MRFGKKLGLKAAKIKNSLRVFDRISEVPGAELLIGQLDEKFGNRHSFNHFMSFDLLCAKTALPKNLPLQRSLLLWVLEPFSVQSSPFLVQGLQVLNQRILR